MVSTPSPGWVIDAIVTGRGSSPSSSSAGLLPSAILRAAVADAGTVALAGAFAAIVVAVFDVGSETVGIAGTVAGLLTAAAPGSTVGRDAPDGR